LLFEAVGNLIDNATKFATSRVTLGARQDEHQVLIEVSDDGAGIPADERDAVLRRFYRAKDAAGVEGTGLGLALVAAILHLHGFALDLDDGSPGLIARIRMPRAHP
jgi:signal transduction histidine kinase